MAWRSLEEELLGRRYLTAAATAAAAGVDRDVAKRLWRAMGFPDAPEDEPLFGDLDVAMLQAAYSLVAGGALDMTRLLALTRATGQAQSRAAESQAREIVEAAVVLGPAAGNESWRQETETALEAARMVAPGLERFITYTWRRHLLDALSRELSTGAEGLTLPLAVGFADLVGFTALSQQASETELFEITSRFEDLAYDLVAIGGGRVIKMIGDEVFFVADKPRAAAEIGLALSSAYSSDQRLPDVRVGLAYGPVVPRAGDYLGPPVNLASRLVNIARPSSVLVSEELAQYLEHEPDLHLRRLRARWLKGIGRVPSYLLSRQEAELPS